MREEYKAPIEEATYGDHIRSEQLWMMLRDLGLSSRTMWHWHSRANLQWFKDKEVKNDEQ